MNSTLIFILYPQNQNFTFRTQFQSIRNSIVHISFILYSFSYNIINILYCIQISHSNSLYFLVCFSSLLYYHIYFLNSSHISFLNILSFFLFHFLFFCHHILFLCFSLFILFKFVVFSFILCHSISFLILSHFLNPSMLSL